MWQQKKTSGRAKVKGHAKVTMILPTYTLQPMFPPSMNFLYLTFSVTLPQTDFSSNLPDNLPTQQGKNYIKQILSMKLNSHFQPKSNTKHLDVYHVFL